MRGASDPPAAGPPAGFRGYRWRVLALVFAATTLNYMDRTVLGVLAPVLEYKVFHWTDQTFAAVTIAFQAAYAIGLVATGALLDRFGTRVGYALSIGTWSLFDFLHAAVRPGCSAVVFPIVRFGFGLGQAGTYPAGVKSVAEWFPRKERALATGIFNAGSNMGAILAPLFVAHVVSAGDGAHWQWAFVGTGSISAACALVWWKRYRRPSEAPGLSAEERAYIESDAGEEREGAPLPWRALLPVPETWAFAVGKTTDLAWWFYTFWVGKFLFDQYGLGVKALAVPLAVIFIAADVGSIGGGFLSSRLLAKGWSLNAARKTTLLLCALLALPVGLATHLGARFRLDPVAFRAAAGSGAAALPSAGIEALASADSPDARAFLARAQAALGPVARQSLEEPLLRAGRSDRRYWIAIALIALAAAAHQAWSATLFTFVSDVFPRKAVASVAGLGGMVGSVSGILASLFLGRALAAHGSLGYSLMFFAAGCSYLAALGVMQALSPRLAPARLPQR